MSDFRLIPIEDLSRRSDTRREDIGATSNLANSIAKVGLTNPITVRVKPDGCFEIIAGSHRYAACDSLGHHEIMCQVVELDDLHAELAMIDENLCRAELSPSDRARQTARCKAIYEELHPEVKQGGAPGLPGGGKAKVDNLSSFADATADATGRDARSVRRDAERGEKVIDEVLDMLRGTRLDTGAYLDKIKRLPPNDQVTAARRDLALDRKQMREVASKETAPASAPKPPIDEAYTHFIELADALQGLRIGDVIAGAGRQRSVLGQRASGLADMMNDIVEGLAQ